MPVFNEGQVVVYWTDIRKEEGTFLLFPRKRDIATLNLNFANSNKNLNFFLTIYFDPYVTSLMRMVEG